MNKKTVLITGSSTGIGHATAELFAEKGWNTVATMRDVSAARDLAGRDNLLVSRLDVTDLGSIDQAINTSIERFGKLDAVINNPGTVSMEYSKLYLRRASSGILMSTYSVS